MLRKNPAQTTSSACYIATSLGDLLELAGVMLAAFVPSHCRNVLMPKGYSAGMNLPEICKNFYKGATDYSLKLRRQYKNIPVLALTFVLAT